MQIKNKVIELMDYKEVIENIYNEVKPLFGKGKVADYIPALANVNPQQYGIAIATLDGKVIGTGDYQTKFSIQSISKVFTLAMVVRHMGSDLWQYVGQRTFREPLSIHWYSSNTNKGFPVTRLSTPGLSSLPINS